MNEVERRGREGEELSTWSLAPSHSFDVEEAAERWQCSPETAEEIVFGREGFLERGLVERVNGSSTMIVTARGAALSRAVARGMFT